MEESKQTNKSDGTKTTATQKPAAGTWIDNRTFFEKYTLTNIIAEIKSKFSGK